MRAVILTVFLIGLTGCCCFQETFRPKDSMYSHRELLDRPTEELTFTIEQVATQFKYQRRLHLESSYICTTPNGPILRLEFITQSILELCEARELLVDLVEELLYKVNTNYIDPISRPAPLTANNLEIYINFESFHVMYVDRFYIGWVALEGGESFFYASTLKNRKLDFWHQHVEPYFKSRTIVSAMRQAEKDYRMDHRIPPSVLRDDYSNEAEELDYPIPYHY